MIVRDENDPADRMRSDRIGADMKLMKLMNLISSSHLIINLVNNNNNLQTGGAQQS